MPSLNRKIVLLKRAPFSVDHTHVYRKVLCHMLNSDSLVILADGCRRVRRGWGGEQGIEGHFAHMACIQQSSPSQVLTGLQQGNHFGPCGFTPVRLCLIQDLDQSWILSPAKTWAFGLNVKQILMCWGLKGKAES